MASAAARKNLRSSSSSEFVMEALGRSVEVTLGSVYVCVCGWGVNSKTRRTLLSDECAGTKGKECRISTETLGRRRVWLQIVLVAENQA